MAKGSTEKTSKERANTGKRGAKRNPQSVIDNVLTGKGLFRKHQPIHCKPWNGSF